MRRIVIAVTALVVLGTASAVYAATSSPINTYTAPIKFTPGKAGSAKKPVPTGFNLNITAKGTNGNRTAVTLDFLTKIYGLKVDGKDFPTCSLNKIATLKNDNACPKGALVATGLNRRPAWSAEQLHGRRARPAHPNLHVWNSGQGKLTFFFVVTPPNHVCGGLMTGEHRALSGDLQGPGQVPGDQRSDPALRSTSRLPGSRGSLSTEHLNWLKRTTKVKGKTVAAISSVGCKGGKRPYSTAIKANLPTTGVTQTATVTGLGQVLVVD